MKAQVKRPTRGLLIMAAVLTLLAISIRAALALSGYYVYANEGSYFTAYGPLWLLVLHQQCRLLRQFQLLKL